MNVMLEKYIEALKIVEEYHCKLNLGMINYTSKKTIRDWLNEFDYETFINTFPTLDRMTLKKSITRVKNTLERYEKLTGDFYIEDVKSNKLMNYRNFGTSTMKVYLKMRSYKF